jgi:outer membrane biosynthesis protein TonB
MRRMRKLLVFVAACGGSAATPAQAPAPAAPVASTTAPTSLPAGRPQEATPAEPDDPDDTDLHAALVVDDGTSAGSGSGSGPGSSSGTGTGWGTIGTGKYGTVAHGSATGNGYGVGGGRGREPAKPTIRKGQTTGGDLDKAIIRRYIKRNVQKIQFCYEKMLVDNPGLAGTVTTTFKIGADGKVTDSKATGLAKVDDCVAKVIASIEFPKPKDQKAIVVTYPFEFRPGSD